MTEANSSAQDKPSSAISNFMARLREVFVNLSDYLWGEKAKLHYLLITSAVVLLAMLNVRELWTQEWRWADITWYMVYTKDYFHPYLAGAAYYDKPLLSYWLMILSSHLFGGASGFSLRFPSVIAGLLVIWCTYKLGEFLVNRRVGFIAGWMLLSTYFFVFWARTASADMLNLAGIMSAVLWYFSHRAKPRFGSYLGFFLILAVTALFKGLIGVVIPVLVILPDLISKNRWKRHLRIDVILALILPLLIYIAPFWASDHSGAVNYAESGLSEVYKENIIRYFHPFDHKDPIYTYLIYLPIYMLPWAIFLLPAVATIPKRFKAMNEGSKWICWSSLLIFVFLTLSGSRRSYYVLPLVPFATLLTAQWLDSFLQKASQYKRYLANIILVSLVVVALIFDVALPLYYANGGLRPFVDQVKQQAEIMHPWPTWNIVFLDAESKLTFYLDSSKPVIILNPPFDSSGKNKLPDPSSQQLLQKWSVLESPLPNTIFITRKFYVPKIQGYLSNYQIVYARSSLGQRLLHIHDADMPAAFIPKQ